MSEYRSLQYHQPAFLHLLKLFRAEITYVLTRKFAEFRGEKFLMRFPINQVIESDFAWNAAREILDSIDNEMCQLASGRSVAYWLHIYRRLGVALSPDHEDKTDPITVGLVRQIAELALQKYGLRGAPNEFGLSDKLSPNIVLGGWMKKGFKSLGGHGQSGELIFRRYSMMLRNKSDWVIRDFSKKDFIDIHAIEGAAYQYWRLTALLRSLGKGARIVVDETGDWDYVPNYSLTQLIVSIDQRNNRSNSFCSLTGVWVDNQSLTQRREEEDTETEMDIVFFPVYNTTRVELSNEFGVNFHGNFVPNFFPVYMRAKPFFEHHEFMREQFIEKRGYDFELLVSVLAALSSFLFLSRRALYADKEADREQLNLATLMQTLNRGYHLFVGSEDDLLEILIERMSVIFSKQYGHDKVRDVLRSITLNNELQRKISLWSNGPRCVIIPAEGVCLVDLVSIPSLLQSIFVFMTDRFGESGTVFEKLFRDALKRRGFDVKSGILVAQNGSERELDAGVIVGERMYLFECVSIERPLDYEIGRPKTLAVRRERLSDKLDQAKSLQAFVFENPTGRNYDFSGAKEFVWAVVSPFVEWIWEFGSDLWLEPGIPRILSPDEVFSHLRPEDV